MAKLINIKKLQDIDTSVKFIRNNNDKSMFDIVTTDDHNETKIWGTIHEDLIKKGIACDKELYDDMPDLEEIKTLYGCLLINGFRKF